MSEIIVKSILLGDTCVGKSTLIHRLVYGQYLPETVSTMGVEFHVIKRNILHQPVKIHIWDTAGQEHLRTIIRSFYFSKTIYYIVYDVCNRVSFEHIQDWIEDIRTHCIHDDPVFVIVGNKIDEYHHRVVTKEEGVQMSQNYNAYFMEISCKDDIGLEHLLERPIQSLIEIKKVKYIPLEKENKKNSKCLNCILL